MYFHGKGVTQNYKEAFKWFKKTADKDILAQYQLGEIYYKGLGVEKNLRESVKWYRKAAEKGYGWAQYQLGRMYYKGEGIIQDHVEAYKWANLATMKIEQCRGLRDTIKKEMTPEQIAEGQKRAREFYDKQQERNRK